MAFSSDTAVAVLSDIKPNSADSAPHEQTGISRADARRVRFALGFMLVVALADVVLYLPRVL
ncbi:MAG: hypothetical protein P4L82_23060 [Ancalomicrobiaceae bacterium]|nr:hypothetical protein [Ancalomicrobiaceae bacterium]